MKTLEDYIRGYHYVPILLVLQYIDKGTRYSLQKEENHDTFYFLKGDEVIHAKRFPHDPLPRLAIDHINDKKNEEIIWKMQQCASYKAFSRFIKEETGNEFTL